MSFPINSDYIKSIQSSYDISKFYELISTLLLWQYGTYMIFRYNELREYTWINHKKADGNHIYYAKLEK